MLLWPEMVLLIWSSGETRMVKRILFYSGLILIILTISARAFFWGPGASGDGIFHPPAAAAGPGGFGLLLEDTDWLLLETGDYLLLE